MGPVPLTGANPRDKLGPRRTEFIQRGRAVPAPTGTTGSLRIRSLESRVLGSVIVDVAAPRCPTNRHMTRYGQVVMLVLYSAGCGSKPTQNPGTRPPSQTAPTAHAGASAGSLTQHVASQPQTRIEARAMLVPAPPKNPKEPIPHEAAVTIPGARSILFAIASPAREEIFVLAQMSQSYGGTFFLVRPDN